MIQQHGTYGNIPQAVRDLVANKCHVLDQYVLCQTGDGEYTALVKNVVTKDVEEIVIRKTGNYSSAYSVTTHDGEWAWNIGNEYYAYSNVGIGSALDLPVYDGVIAHTSCFITVLLAFLVIYRGVFAWVKK